MPHTKLQSERLINYLAEIALGELSISLEEIQREQDDSMRELLFGLLCLHEDLTLQRNEVATLNAFLQNILQSFTDLLFIIDENGYVQMINKQTVITLEKMQELIIGTHIQQHLQFTDETPWAKELFTSNPFPIARLISLIDSNRFIELPMLIITESISIPVLVTASSMMMTPTTSGSIILSAKDGRQSRILKELQEKQQQLIQASKLASMGELSSGIAHELNNPLFAISGLTEIIQMKLQHKHPEIYPEVAKQIETMMVATEKMRDIINHIRIFARQESLAQIPYSLNQIIQSALLLTQEQLRQNNIDLVLLLSEKEPIVFCTPNRLEQVIINLISNAKDAILSRQQSDSLHKGTIEIRTTIHLGKICLTVNDNGIGMDEATKAKIFDPFYSTKEIGKGTGLGLSISYGIIQEHKGQIEVQSTVGEKTNFKLCFPLYDNA